EPLALLETPDLLKSWLEHMLPNDVAGECGDPSFCVLSEYLRSEGLGPYISVGRFDVLIGTDEVDARQYILPEWCRALIGCIDAYGFGSFIRANRVLELLQECQP